MVDVYGRTNIGPMTGITTVNSYLTTLKVVGLGAFLNVGCQFVVNKKITIEGYFGLGLTINSKEYSYSPPGTADTGEVQYYYAYIKQGKMLPSITGGINVGYVFP
ncbi:MAG TPA: hypothetical protein VNZ49_17695 [Bacteroidia bacterium]|nr:hypothetical protein [Bacteroidia bacterium]